LAEPHQNWKMGHGNMVNVADFDWKQAEVDRALIKVNSFLTVGRPARQKTGWQRTRLIASAARSMQKRQGFLGGFYEYH
jgi:hypothetical protein